MHLPLGWLWLFAMAAIVDGLFCSHDLWCALGDAGKVSQLRLLGDYAHPTRIAFVEFVMAEGAMAALHCSGALLGEHGRQRVSMTCIRMPW